jgi:hypothetical protein
MRRLRRAIGAQQEGATMAGQAGRFMGEASRDLTTPMKGHAMSYRLDAFVPRCLLAAGLVFGAAAAMAAGGYTVNQKQEAQIKVGMSQDEVRQIVGQPVRVDKFGSEPGPTWTYDVAGGLGHVSMFDVDFGADGRVASAQERIIEVD